MGSNARGQGNGAVAGDDRFDACAVARGAAAHPDRLAVTEFLTGRRLTYRQLDDAVGRTAAWLTRLSPSEGGRVAFLGRNNLEQVLVHYAARRCGRIHVPLNWRLAGEELAAIVQDCEPEALIHQPEFSAQAGRALQAVPGARSVVSPPEAAVVWAAIEGETAMQPAGDPSATAALIYTSGTTGRPKGVILTPRGMGFAAYNWTGLARLDAGSAMILDAPLFHIIGLLAILAGTLLAGGTVHVSDRFDAAATLDRLNDAELGVTHYFGVPQMAQALADLPGFAAAPLPRLKAMFSGGAPLAPSLIDAYLARGLPLANGYGMTEIGSVLGPPLDAEAIRAHMGSVGLPAPAMEVRIVGEGGRDAAPGEAGEIHLRSPSLTPGYWRNPQATAEAMGDGWLRTGDAAVMGADGWVRLLDRYKDMYVTGGENVYPAEVEAALGEIPQIAEAAVIGVPDPRWGESGAAYVSLRPGAGLTAQDIVSFCEARLARYKRPAHIRFLDEMPRTGSGKIKKDALRALYLSETAKESAR